MARQVFCQKYQETLEGLPVPPYKGPRGEWIYENVSRKAWMEWLQHQTRLINEKGLSMIKAEDREGTVEAVRAVVERRAGDRSLRDVAIGVDVDPQ